MAKNWNRTSTLLAHLKARGGLLIGEHDGGLWWLVMPMLVASDGLIPMAVAAEAKAA